jgi:phage I-like protein
LRNAQAVISASMTAGKLPLDENHSTMVAANTGGAAPARGWIVELQERGDGLWGRVEWTAAGTALMADQAYKGISPVFDYAKDGTILRIRNAALTNNPNLTQLTAMHTVLTAAQRDQLKPEDFAVPDKRELPLHDAHHVALAWDMVDRTEGLTASERAEARRRIRVKAKELGVDTSGWSAHTEGQMDKTAICTALGIAETMGDAAVLTALQTTMTENARLKGELEAVQRTHVPLERVTAMQTQLDTMVADGKQAKAVAFVDAAIAAGKPISAARDVYIAQHVADAAIAEKMINTLPSINAVAAGPARTTMHAAGAAGDMDGLTPEDTAVCSKMGVDPKKLLEARKKAAGKGAEA